MKIRREGLPFIIGSGLISFALYLTRIGIFGLAPVLFVLWFFRDPERTIPVGDEFVISPADGKVLSVTPAEDDRVGQCTRIAIFMSVFSVHVNRAAVSGKVIDKKYKTGKFHMANVGRKTDANERMIHYIENSDGVYRIDQVAGLIARRIIFYPEVGSRVEAGEVIGLI
ncbi:phosphatidylserine decarboxylase family protein, partial [bacterium]|nr:phosphatidylserine decarboxylase family protein [bacterium]